MSQVENSLEGESKHTFEDMKSLWKRLYPHTKTKQGIKACRELVDRGFINMHNPDEFSFFFRGTKKFFDQLSEDEAPWTKWPLAHMATCEDPSRYDVKSSTYIALKTDIDDMKSILLKAKSPEDVE